LSRVNLFFFLKISSSESLESLKKEGFAFIMAAFTSAAANGSAIAFCKIVSHSITISCSQNKKIFQPLGRMKDRTIPTQCQSPLVGLVHQSVVLCPSTWRLAAGSPIACDPMCLKQMLNNTSKISY
jgi:hypothetical protein